MKIVAACKRYANSMIAAETLATVDSDEEPIGEIEELVEMRRQESEKSIDLQLA